MHYENRFQFKLLKSATQAILSRMTQLHQINLLVLTITGLVVAYIHDGM